MFVGATLMSVVGFLLLLASRTEVLYIAVLWSDVKTQAPSFCLKMLVFVHLDVDVVVWFCSVATSYGAFNALCPTLICEIFGCKHFGLPTFIMTHKNKTKDYN